MENYKDTHVGAEHTRNANTTSYYTLIALAVVVGMVGVFLRFIAESTVVDLISNIVLIIAIALALRAVFNILK